ncbi:MAG: D-2-hydroxyacid dehydrogenase family protein [Comamonas sp.]
MLKILLLDDYQGRAREWADWSALPDTQVDVLEHALPDLAARQARFAGYQVIVAMRERTPFPPALLEALPELQLLVTTGMRNAAIDLAACARLGITVCGAPGSKDSAGATAELAWALMLALAKRLPQSRQALLEGQWQPQLTQSLAGRTLGLAGLGQLGKRMALIGQAMGMQVIAWSPHLDAAAAACLGVEAVSKAALFRRADWLSLHLVLSESTRHIVGPEDLAAMQPHAHLLTPSRAGLVAPGALLHALQAGHIAGAGIDVFDTEPALDEPLLALPQVLATPHLGYATDDNFRAFYANALQAVAAWRAGAPVRVLSA